MTLIEKSVVAFIIGLLGAIAVPTWGGFASAQQLKVDADAIQFNLQDAKSEATTKKLQLESALKTCKTEASCWGILEKGMQQASCDYLAAALTTSPSLLLQYREQADYVLWEDGSCSLPTTTTVSQTHWDHYALAAQTPNIVRESYSQPLLALLDANVGQIVSTNKKPIDKGHDRRDPKAAKKTAKNKLVVEGCFRLNGQFLLKQANGYAQVDWSSLPTNTVINTKAPLCPSVNVN